MYLYYTQDHIYWIIVLNEHVDVSILASKDDVVDDMFHIVTISGEVCKSSPRDREGKEADGEAEEKACNADCYYETVSCGVSLARICAETDIRTRRLQQ